MRSRQRGGEEPDNRGERPSDRADELGTEHVSRRQRGEPLDLDIADHGTFEQASADHQHVVGLRGVVQDLCHGRGVTLGVQEGDRRRPVDQLQHLPACPRPRPRGA